MVDDIVGEYNFEFMEGDTYSGFLVKLSKKEVDVHEIGEPIDLTGSTIQMRIQSKDKVRRKSFTLSTSNKRISIVDSEGGQFKIVKQKIELPQGVYEHTIKINFPNGDQRTYVQGQCEVRVKHN